MRGAFAADTLRSAWSTARWLWSHPLGSRNRAAAFGRFARWQIGSRLRIGASVVPFAGGTVLLVRPGMTGATGNVYVGLQEFEDMAFLLHSLREADRFIDVGANVGSYSVLASGVCGAETIAVEPLPSTFRSLCENVRLNDLGDRVRAVNVGLASAPGKLRFTTGLDTVNHVLAADELPDGGAVDVEVTTLDRLTADKVPALIKVDVEGFETEVFAGAETTLGQPELRALIVELNGSGARYGFDESALQRRIESFGFRPHAYEPFSRALRPLKGKNLVGNTIYVRDRGEVIERLRTATPVRVLGLLL